jgi:hypothetical protein
MKKRDSSAAADEGNPVVKVAELFERDSLPRFVRRGNGHQAVELNRVLKKTQEYFIDL